MAMQRVSGGEWRLGLRPTAGGGIGGTKQFKANRRYAWIEFYL